MNFFLQYHHVGRELSNFALTVTFCVLCLIAPDFSAQTIFDRSYPHKENSAPPVLFAHHSDLYFSDENAFVRRVGPQGQQKPYQINSWAGLITTGGEVFGDKLVFFGYENNLCGSGSLPFNGIAVTDSAGNAPATYTFNASHGPVTAWVQLSDSTLRSFAGSRMVMHNASGSIVSQDSLSVGSISSALSLPSGNILLSAISGSIPVLAEITASGTVIGTYTQTVQFEKMVWFGTNAIICLGKNGTLYKLNNSNYNMVSSSGPWNSFSDFSVYSDTVHLIGTLGINKGGYIVADSSLSFLSSSTNTTQAVDHRAIAMTADGHVAVLYLALASTGTHISQPYIASHTCIGIYAAPRQGTFAFRKNLSVRNLVPTYLEGFGGNTPILKMKANVTVRNVGTQPVSSFYLNCFQYVPVHCGDLNYLERFNVPLQPGDSVVVGTSFIERAVHNVTTQGNYVTAEFCVYVTLPDSTTDEILPGNELCRTYSALMDDLPEVDAGLFRLYPNPAHDRFVVEGGSAEYLLTVRDVTGRVLWMREHASGKVEIESAEWKRGLYFMELQSERGRGTARMVKD